MFTPRVVDTSHWVTIGDLQKTADAGIWGIITKCTQGTGYVDKTYETFRKKTLEAGMLFGAYHFNSGSDPEEQVEWFIEQAKPDANTLMALDYEKNEASRTATNMSPDQMVAFLRHAEKLLGRKLIIYSGNYLKEAMPKLSKEDRLYVCEHKLWLAHYSSKPKLPLGFEKWWLHQYTGDGLGPEPHNIPGLNKGTGNVDLNRYEGTFEQLKAEWAS